MIAAAIEIYVHTGQSRLFPCIKGYNSNISEAITMSVPGIFICNGFIDFDSESAIAAAIKMKIPNRTNAFRAENTAAKRGGDTA
jgi:hypothetical protein